jgi:hypothetical protein
VRNNAFDAHNYFDDPARPVPTLSQNQFGVNIGGPIRRDHSFFFFSYEGQRVRRAQTQTFSVPTEALRSGDFSGLSALCDPLTRTSAGACTPFAANQIPAGRILRVPIAHGEGCYFADEATLARLNANQQVLWRYVNAAGEPTGLSVLTAELLAQLPHLDGGRTCLHVSAPSKTRD